MELQFKNVTKAYGDVHAVDHVTHSMEKGVYGLLGVNGAGQKGHFDADAVYSDKSDKRRNLVEWKGYLQFGSIL